MQVIWRVSYAACLAVAAAAITAGLRHPFKLGQGLITLSFCRPIVCLYHYPCLCLFPPYNILCLGLSADIKKAGLAVNLSNNVKESNNCESCLNCRRLQVLWRSCAADKPARLRRP